MGAHTVSANGPLVGQGGTGASFDGATSAVALPGAADEPGTDPYTFELWARPERVDGVYRFLIAHEATVAGKRAGTGVWLSKAGLGFERWSNGQSTSIDYRLGLALGQWSYVLASYDGSTMRLYVNGAQVGSRATTAPLTAVSAATTAGAGAGANGGFFAGDLADTALYPQALARAHVAAHYADGTHAPCTAITGASGATYTPCWPTSATRSQPRSPRAALCTAPAAKGRATGRWTTGTGTSPSRPSKA